LTPMVCSRFLRPPRASHGRLYNASERVFTGALHLYERTLRWTLRHRRLTLGVLLLTVVATGYLFQVVPKGFIPNEDTGQIFGVTEGPQDISFESLVQHQKQVAEIVATDPYVEDWYSAIGGSTVAILPNQGRVFFHLKPRAERPDVEQVIQHFRPKLAKVLGMRVFLQNIPTIRIGGTLSKALYQYTLQDTDLQELYSWVPIVEAKMRELPGLIDVNTDLMITSPQVLVNIDRNQASAHGVSVAQIENALYDAYGSRQVSTIYAPNNHALRQVKPGITRSPERGGDADSGGRSAHGQPPRSAPRRHDFLQPKAWRVPWRRRGRNPEDAARAAPAGHTQRAVPGHGPGV